MTDTPRAALVQETLSQLHYPGLRFETMREGSHLHLRVHCPEGSCNVSGEAASWNGRWWRISNYTTRQEIVGTAFKAILTALEHEAREQFLYKGQAIYDGHLDVDKLAELRAGDGGLDERA